MFGAIFGAAFSAAFRFVAGILSGWSIRKKARREGRDSAVAEMNEEQERLRDEIRESMDGADKPIDRESAASAVRDRARRRGRQ